MVVLGSVFLLCISFEQLDSQSRTWNCHGYQTHAKHKFYDILGHKQVESHIKSFYQTWESFYTLAYGEVHFSFSYFFSSISASGYAYPNMPIAQNLVDFVGYLCCNMCMMVYDANSIL